MFSVLDPVRYAAAGARVRGRVGRLLSSALWAELLNTPDLAALVQRLSGTVYREELARHTGDELDLGRVEGALWAYLVEAYRAPLPFLQGDARTLVDELWRRFEVDNLKTILRTVERDVAPERIRASLMPLGPASSLPWEALTTAHSIGAVVDRLADTRYGRVLEGALDRYRREGLLFVLEVALDLFYYRRLTRLLHGLSGQDRTEAERFVGTLVDSQNLLWAFRYRIHFDLSPEEILNYTLTRGHRVNADVIRDVATGAPVYEVVQSIWDERLPDVEPLANQSDAEALSTLELLFWRFLHQEAQHALQGYSLHLGPILAYEVLLESEVRDLVVLVEGTSASWDAEHIRSYLIGARGES